MAESGTNMEDLEDGEIESEGEEATDNQNVGNEEPSPKQIENRNHEKSESHGHYYPKSGKKKKSKSKGDSKFKEKSKKNRKYLTPTEEDFAGSIEKAIRKAMNKNDSEELNKEDDVDDRRKHKKRKKNDTKDESAKRRKKEEYHDEMDESEMMCVRGASPVHRQSPPADNYQEDERDSYASDSSQDSRGNQNHRQNRNNKQRDRVKNKSDRRRVAPHPMQDPDGVCLYFMQGRCHMGDECVYSHDAQPPRKMELCKFYLMDCCAKRDKCLYMHSDFPCKYYHTGLPCIYKDECKFAHGKPLTESLKNILLKHIESAPKEILGDFPRLNREGALKMIQVTQAKLIKQFPESMETQEKTIPSLFELNIPNPQIQLDNSLQFNQFNNERSSKVSPKVRQSRWQNDHNHQNLNLSPNNNTNTPNVLSIKNLTGVLTPRQISDLTKMGIENLDQLGQLTVLQLNNIGLSLKQITEIQLNTMNIQKLGLINTVNDTPPQQFIASTGIKDLDLRVPPVVSVSTNSPLPADFPGKDVDMRFQPPVVVATGDNNTNVKVIQKDSQISNKDMIDIDQYTKDALKFASKDKENIDISNESFDDDKPIVPAESKDVDHRVLQFPDQSPQQTQNSIDDIVKKGCDTDIRFLQPEPIFKNPERRNRRSTTDDDDDNNLLIDDKWYSSDEEKGIKKRSPMSSPRQVIMSPRAPVPHVIEPSTVLSRLGDLSKIDISEEVTKLLNTMKKNTSDVKNETEGSEAPQKPRDPRARRSPDKGSDSVKPNHKKPLKVSIYECVDGEPTDGRRRTDVDLRKSDFIPAFGDTDLRHSTSGDIDFRLGLPFKPIPNYTPASEIDGSINSHPPIPYKLLPVHIPRPDYTDIKNSTAKSQALVDPRLRKVFRLSMEESSSDSEKPTKPVSTAPRVDPRRKPKDNVETNVLEQKTNSLDIQSILQNSNWYKELSSTQKIFVNQHLAPVTQNIKQFQQDKASGKKFDLAPIQSNTILCNIFANLGISLGDNGEFSYLPKPKEALLKTPAGFNQNPLPFGNMTVSTGAMDGPNMNMLNMPPMGLGPMNNMNLGNVHGFNQPLSDPRGGPMPGLLGIAPNIPHNFNNGKFGGPNNFGNMPFNGPGPGNDFNFMDGEPNFPRFPNRGGHRGRGNDRWNRGGSNRGNRDRKNFNDRGNWKNDRN